MEHGDGMYVSCEGEEYYVSREEEPDDQASSKDAECLCVEYLPIV